MANPLSEFFGGFGLLLRGAGIVLRRPKLFGLGVIPPLITSVLFLAALILLLVNIADIVVWMSPFAEGWQPAGRNALRVAFGVALVVGAVLVMVVAFTTATLAFGSPIYDKIGELVESELGNAPAEAPESRLGSVVRSARQSVAIVLLSLLVTVGVFATGLIPLVGQVVAPVLSALLGGWVLSMELVGNAFDRRGKRRLADRRAAMRRRRMRVLGFAVPAFLLLAIPFVAVAVFPAAVAGGTILARDILPHSPRQGPMAERPGLPPNAAPPSGAGPFE